MRLQARYHGRRALLLDLRFSVFLCPEAPLGGSFLFQSLGLSIDWGPICGSPYDKDHSRLRSVFGPSIYGSPHILKTRKDTEVAAPHIMAMFGLWDHDFGNYSPLQQFVMCVRAGGEGGPQKGAPSYRDSHVLTSYKDQL